MLRNTLCIAALALAACSIENTAFHATPDGGAPADVLAIKVSPSASFDVPEGGTATFDVSLTKPPPAELIVRIAPADTDAASRIGLSLPELRFEPSNFAVPQTITVTGLVDVDTANGVAGIKLTADGLDPVTLTATVQDPDKVEIVTDIAASGTLTISETRSVDVHVHLTHQPAADVRMTVALGVPGPVLVVPGQTTFTAANWDKDQTFTFTAPDDPNILDETQSLTFSATGAPDRLYTIHDLDKDKLNISVTPSQPITVNEGGGTQLSVALTKQPPANTTVHIAVQLGNVAVDHTDLTFTPQNFSQAQAVTVSAPQDANTANENDQITLSIPNSDVASVMIGVTTIDDDVQAILDDAPNPLSVTENQTAAFGVTLKFQPTTTVTVTVASQDANVATASPGTLTFTPQNYNIASMHQVTVRGSDDNNLRTDATSIQLHEPTLVDVRAPVNVLDDDIQQIVVNPTQLTVAEGMMGTFGVSLKFDPSTTVTLNLSDDNMASLPINKTSLTFLGGPAASGGNWQTPQSVTVSPPTDPNAMSETGTVTITGAGAPTPATVALTAMDNTVLQTWGWPDTFSTTTALTAGFAFAYRINVGAVANLGAFHVYVPTGVGLFRMALYTDLTAAPNHLVAQMGDGKVMVNGVNDGAPLSNVQLTDPTYWLVVRFSNNVNIGYDGGGTAVNRCISGSKYGSISDPWVTDFTDRSCGNDHLFNIWITTFHQ
jgi:hypothetical protein